LINTTITPKVTGPINTFKIGNKTYIPLSVIPKKHSSYFRQIPKPAIKPIVVTPILKVNG